ncbi:hypothetical protein XELAEV_18010950mg [Xenopus laevis]|uniref:Uncharacterized protein n=1 Tax=Xenopus laevis TaxID=8355 RepID=A0A974I1Z8_XENLA|nr:hypothetical protein XELAEV_18010950mg [Xenopus laevis]
MSQKGNRIKFIPDMVIYHFYSFASLCSEFPNIALTHGLSGSNKQKPTLENNLITKVGQEQEKPPFICHETETICLQMNRRLRKVTHTDTKQIPSVGLINL